jgi:hypothetical protein
MAFFPTAWPFAMECQESRHFSIVFYHFFDHLTLDSTPPPQGSKVTKDFPRFSLLAFLTAVQSEIFFPNDPVTDSLVCPFSRIVSFPT